MIFSLRSKENNVEKFGKYINKRIKDADDKYLCAYSYAILRSLRIIFVPLDRDQDAQTNFEGLNYKGLSLKASELLCNFIFKPLLNEDLSYEKWHTNKWLKSIKIVGGDKNFEEYLRNLFSIGKQEQIGRGRKMYISFKKENKNFNKEKAIETIDDISESAEYYSNIIDPENSDYLGDNRDINRLLCDIKLTDVGACTPFLLATLKDIDNKELSVDQGASLLREILTLLVRRKICCRPSNKYNVFFPNLLEKIKSQSNSSDDLIPCLTKIIEERFSLLNDSEFEKCLIELPLYLHAQRLKPFIRFILIKIDEKMTRYKQTPNYRNLNTIEHVMPQKLEKDWEDYLGEEEVERVNQLKIIDTIGNLCLLSRSANSSQGRDPFESKKSSVAYDACVLSKNIKSKTGKWNSQAIQNRSKELAKEAIEIWKWTYPPPSIDLDSIGPTDK